GPGPPRSCRRIAPAASRSAAPRNPAPPERNAGSSSLAQSCVEVSIVLAQIGAGWQQLRQAGPVIHPGCRDRLAEAVGLVRAEGCDHLFALFGEDGTGDVKQCTTRPERRPKRL